MDRELFKKQFKQELAFFSLIANRDIDAGFSRNQVEDELIKYASSFYGARVDFDKYAVKKCYFVATFFNQIIKGKVEDIDINDLYDEILEERKIRERGL